MAGGGFGVGGAEAMVAGAVMAVEAQEGAVGFIVRVEFGIDGVRVVVVGGGGGGGGWN